MTVLANLLSFIRSDFESEYGDEATQSNVSRLMPKRVKRRRKAATTTSAVDAGADDGGWEEYFDYIFPEDENARPNLKLLAMAKMWKKQKAVEEVVGTTSEEATSSSTAEGLIKVEDMDQNPDEENPDADDVEIKNEISSSEDEESEDEEGSSQPPEKKRKDDDDESD